MLQCCTLFLLLCVSTTNAKSAQESIPSSLVSPFQMSVTSVGSVAAGCSLCRDSGTCSMAINDTSSGVFCGDIVSSTTAETKPCCCAYYTECRATRMTQTCMCGGAWPFVLPHERLSAIEVAVANATNTRLPDHFITENNDQEDNEMSAMTEILIHLSVYLALFVFAMYVDQLVECLSDFRRHEMITYVKSSDMKFLHFRQRFRKRRRNSQPDDETDDNRPLLMCETPTPTVTPAFTCDVTSDADSFACRYNEKEELAPVSEQIVLVTAHVNVVQEMSITHVVN